MTIFSVSLGALWHASPTGARQFGLKQVRSHKDLQYCAMIFAHTDSLIPFCWAIMGIVDFVTSVIYLSMFVRSLRKVARMEEELRSTTSPNASGQIQITSTAVMERKRARSLRNLIEKQTILVAVTIVSGWMVFAAAAAVDMYLAAFLPLDAIINCIAIWYAPVSCAQENVNVT